MATITQQEHTMHQRTAGVLALSLLAACAEPPAGITESGVAAQYAAARPSDAAWPITGRCETTFNPPPLPPPPVFTQTDTGTCTIAHLGRAAFHSVKEINFLSGTQTTTEASFTAANGDVLRAVGSGTSAPAGPGQIGFSATLTFTGGTGRFLNAHGEAHVTGVATLATTTAVLEITGGWIAYDASDRR
jgi:hypothetical protein